MYKYQVTPVETKKGSLVNTLQSKELSKSFSNKTKALDYVEILKKDFSVISFYTDFYKAGKCIKNIEGIFENGVYRKINEITYKQEKQKEIEINPKKYFAHLFN